MNAETTDTTPQRPNLHLILEEAGVLLRPPVPSDVAVLAEELIDPAMGVASVADPSVWTRRIALWMTGRSPDESEDWLTWMVVTEGRVAGYVQATLSADRRHAELAWVLFLWAQGRGLATRAMRLVAAHAVQAGVADLVAHIAPGHAASEGVARRIGLAPTDVLFDGEREWRASAEDLSLEDPSACLLPRRGNDPTDAAATCDRAYTPAALPVVPEDPLQAHSLCCRSVKKEPSCPTDSRTSSSSGVTISASPT